jgi:hypothetical protein
MNSLNLVEYSLQHMQPSSTDAIMLKKDGWEFDWSVDSSKTGKSEKVGLFVDGDLQGLVEYEPRPQDTLNYIHIIESAPQNRGKSKIFESVPGILFAFVARDSLEAGFEGFVMFESKSKLYNYYIEQYGAIPLPGRFLHFDTKAAVSLIDKYLGGGTIAKIN